MTRKTSLLFVLGLSLSTTVGVIASTTLNVKAQTKQPIVEAQLPTAAPESTPAAKPKVTAQSASRPGAIEAASVCFTCGGDFPVFAGSIRSVGDTPTERGPGCSGSLISRTDSSPFLCTK